MTDLQRQLNAAYKPGLCEFMINLQIHHAKLYFAGTNENWALADFEIHEIKEALEDIETFCSDRTETKSITIIEPVIDSLNTSIAQKNKNSFNNDFNLLTNSCNNCHQSTGHSFNVIKTPDTPPFSNQVFKLNE